MTKKKTAPETAPEEVKPIPEDLAAREPASGPNLPTYRPGRMPLWYTGATAPYTDSLVPAYADVRLRMDHLPPATLTAYLREGIIIPTED